MDARQSAERRGSAARQNRSFTFFRIVGLSDDREAVGAQGVPLTSGRSIAVDNSLHLYGTPFFIQARLPLTNEKQTASFARLMIAQDTGSAIVGPARADIYFGAGDQAGQLAGLIHNSGNFAMLVPPAQKSSTTCRIFGSPCAIAKRAEVLTPDWRRKSLEQGLRTQSSLFLALRRRTLSPHQPSWSNLSAQ
jgi:membrane-bound lytic murein transglycosylase A